MSKEKSLRERREDNERKRLARQSLPNPKEISNSKKTTREQKQNSPSRKLNSGARDTERTPTSKVGTKVNTKRSFGKNIFESVSIFAKENLWLFIAYTLFITLVTLIVLYNFSSILYEDQKVIVAPLTIIPGYFLWYKLAKQNKTGKVRLKVITTFVCGVFIVIFTVGMFSSVTVGGKVYLSTSETAKVQKVTKSMWKDLEVIASAETLLLSTGAESRAFFPTMRDQSEELGKLSIKWAKISQTENLPAPGLVEAASQIATSADWGSRALIRKAQSIAEPDPRADADVAEWTKLYQGNGSAAGETVIRVSELYGIKLGVTNE